MRTLFLQAFLLASAAACGSDGTGTTAGAASTQDAGGGGNASTPAEWKSGGHAGFVHLRHEDGKLVTAALFYAVPSTGATCSRTTSGPCALSDCTLPEGADAGTVAADAVSDPAGRLAFRGGALPGDYGVAYGADGRYSSAETPLAGTPWNEGDPITFENTGEWVPRFTTTLAGPALDVKVSAPALAESVPLAIDRTQPLAFTWTGASAGTVSILVQTAGEGRRSVSAKCTFDAAPGAGTIPAAVLATMIPGPGTARFQPASEALVTAGDYQVEVSVQTRGTAGALTFQ